MNEEFIISHPKKNKKKWGGRVGRMKEKKRDDEGGWKNEKIIIYHPTEI